MGALAGAALTTLGAIVVVDSANAANALVTVGSVNLRSGPGTSFSIVLTVPPGGRVSAAAPPANGWVKVTYGTKTGFLSARYTRPAMDGPAGAPAPSASVPTTSGVGPPAASGGGSARTTGSVNVRIGPGTSYRIVAVAPPGTVVRTTGTANLGWLPVTWGRTSGWIHSNFLVGGPTPGAAAPAAPPSPATATPSATPAPPAPTVVTGPATSTAWPGQPVSARVAAVLDYARSKVGASYVWGGSGPASFDCSGLTQAAYAKAGVSLPHKASYQATMGQAVTRADLKPGDLLFWYTPVGHVSLYVGNGLMVHARGTAYGVVVQSVDEYARSAPFVGARRYLP